MVFVPIYCEKPLFSGFFEPLNFLSSLLFIISAIGLFFLFKNNKIKDVKSRIFLVLVFLVGVGSLLWHLKRDMLTLFLDIIPILVFLLVYFYFLLLRISKDKRFSFFGIIAYIVLTIIMSFVLRATAKSAIFNGAYEYIPAALFLFLLVIYSYIKDITLAKRITVVFLLFVAALFSRQVDLMICPYLRFGTHFLWHLLNSINIYYSVKILYLKY